MRNASRTALTATDVMTLMAVGILFVLIVLPNVMAPQGSWSQREVLSNLRALLTALEMYRSPAPDPNPDY